MTITDELISINQSKNAIKQEIKNKGGNIDDTTLFADYANIIKDIKSSGAGTFSEQCELNITAPKEITINSTGLLGVEKLVAGTAGKNIEVCNFDSADSTGFIYNNKFITFDGTMHPVTSYAVAMSTPTALGSGYLSTSDEFDISQWQTVENIKVTTTGEATITGIALMAAGGGAGTWATYEGRQ